MIGGVKTFGGLIGTANPRVVFRSLTAAAPDTRATLPANKAGDIMIVLQLDVLASHSQAQPAGWTTIGGQFQTYGIISGAAKISTGNETGTVYSTDNATPSAAWVLILRGGWASWSGGVAADREFTSGNPPSVILPCATLGTKPFLAFFAYFADTSITSDTFTGDTPDDEQSSDNGSSEFLKVKWKYYAAGSTPADITADMDDEGGHNGLLSLIMDLAA